MSWYEPHRTTQALSNFELLKNLVDPESPSVKETREMSMNCSNSLNEQKPQGFKRKNSDPAKPRKKKITKNNFI